MNQEYLHSYYLDAPMLHIGADRIIFGREGLKVGIPNKAMVSSTPPNVLAHGLLTRISPTMELASQPASFIFI
jgi:hypothetical protein